MFEAQISSILTQGAMPELDTPFAKTPRVRFANLPTPIESAVRLSEHLGGPRIHIKRDDLTGLATGGNKTRKLEFLIGDALAQGADTILTAGGPQSNHCRQTAAAAARCGLECHLVFGGIEDASISGNRFLDHLFGATEHWTPKGTRETKMASLSEELIEKGKKPYIIPVGGSNGIGAIGSMAAMYELNWQCEQADLKFDHIVFATSSGGTQAGFVVGKLLTQLPANLVAISIDQVPDGQTTFDYKQFVFEIAQELDEKLSLGLNCSLADFTINYDFLGGGYGVVGDLERDAISVLAKVEGILVDPVYAGRALGGLISLIESGKFGKDENVLFWHTGGETALHAYVDDLIIERD